MTDENTQLLIDSIAKINNPTQNPVNVRLIDTNEYLKQKCDDKISNADEKLKTNFEKLELFITVNTFFGGLLLFGLNGTKQKESYMAGEKRIIQLEIVDFCLFLGTIMTAFVFITLTKFRSFDSKSGWKWCSCITYFPGPDPCCCKSHFQNLHPDKQTLYKESSNKYLPYNDNDNIQVYEAATKEDNLRTKFRQISMLMVALLTLVAISLLVYVVLTGANYQLDNTKDKEAGSGFDNWVFPLCITLVVAPPLVAFIITLCFTGRIYDCFND
mmetsp:Transcript_62581/g.70813  ORF Transcript_62581/g.70813 Transcript_62581/m.70813 type:complete len:271 (-) Transcript_62581:16-828(-)